MTGQIAWSMLLLYQFRKRFLWPRLHRFPSHSGSPVDSVEALCLIASGLVAYHCHVRPLDEEHDIPSSSKGANRDCIGLHLTLASISWGCTRNRVAFHDWRNPCAWRPLAPYWFWLLCPFLWLSCDHRAAICSIACVSIHHPCPTASPSIHSWAAE